MQRDCAELPPRRGARSAHDAPSTLSRQHSSQTTSSAERLTRLTHRGCSNASVLRALSRGSHTSDERWENRSKMPCCERQASVSGFSYREVVAIAEILQRSLANEFTRNAPRLARRRCDRGCDDDGTSEAKSTCHVARNHRSRLKWCHCTLIAQAKQ